MVLSKSHSTFSDAIVTQCAGISSSGQFQKFKQTSDEGQSV